MYVRHAYISGLHHYIIIRWDDDIEGWSIGIAALPSKRQARKFAGGIFDRKEDVAAVTNHMTGVRVSWFTRELECAMDQLGRKFGPHDWYAIPVDNQRFRVYRYLLGKRGWTVAYRLLDDELVDVMAFYKERHR